MKVPIVINNRNRLTTTKKMVEKLFEINENEHIIIIDNASTYQPLLDWYEQIKEKVDIRFVNNYGHLALWEMGLHKELGDYFVYTDSDIELNDNFPLDWKEIMLNTLRKYNERKIALAIRIEDIPDHYKYKNQVKRNEGRWWLEEVEQNVYKADTDTTFFLIKNFADNCYQSLRLAREDLICRHKTWYFDLDNLDTEEIYYLNNLGDRVTTQYSKQHKDKEKYNDI
jgi:hypothetical protein